MLTGTTPTAVSTTAGRFPGQLPAGPIVHSTHLRFADPGAPHVVLTFVNAVPAPTGFDYRLVLDGTRASLLAGLTHLDYLPHTPTPDATPVADPVSGDWVPDGFAGALRALVRHLRHGGPLPHHGADHLASLAVADAAARSARHHGAWIDVTVPEATGPSQEVDHAPDLRDYLL